MFGTNIKSTNSATMTATVPLYKPIPRNIMSGSSGGGPATAEIFFRLASSMLGQFRDVLLNSQQHQQHQQQQQDNRQQTPKSSASTFDRVTAYGMLSECSFQEQVQALTLLKQWFSDFIARELAEKILGDVAVAPTGKKMQQQQQQQQRSTTSLPSPRQMITRIALFLAAYSKLVAFARSCYLALESPQFLGKYSSISSVGSSNNTSLVLAQQQFKAGLSFSSYSSSSASSSSLASSSEAFVPSILRDMLREVASDRLKPFLLRHLPRVLHRLRVEHQKSSSVHLPAALMDLILSAATSSTAATSASDSDSDTKNNKNKNNFPSRDASSSSSDGGINNNNNSSSPDTDLALLAYVVGFFRSMVSSATATTAADGGGVSSPSSPTHVRAATTTAPSQAQHFATARERHEETLFRKDFFNSYLSQLSLQYAAMGRQLVRCQSADPDWAAKCFHIIDSLLESEKRVGTALFPGQPHLQHECIQTASGAFVSECAAPLIGDARHGISALLKRGAVNDAARLITLVATEAAALPALTAAVEQSMRAHLAAAFQCFQNEVDDIVSKSSNNTSNNNKNNSTGSGGTGSSATAAAATMSVGDIIQAAHYRRMKFMCELLEYIQQWNLIVHRSLSTIRLTLEKIRKSVFRESLDGRTLKGVVAGLRVTQAHIADVLAQYCDQLLRGETKGTDILPSLNPTAQQQQHHRVSDDTTAEASSAAASSGGGTKASSSASSSSLLFSSSPAGGFNTTNSASSSSNNNNNNLDTMVLVFDLVAQLLSFLKDKDVAIELHRLRTARRLLERKANLDLECVLAHKLSHVVELSQTRKFEGMFADVERWAEELVLFSNSSSSNSSSCELIPSILTSSKWPAFRLRHCLSFAAFPALDESIQRFLHFYHKHTNFARKLSWVVDSCTAAAIVAFPKGQKELNGTLIQILVLMAVDEMAPKKRGQQQQRQQQGGGATAATAAAASGTVGNNNIATGDAALSGVTLDEVVQFCCTNPETKRPTMQPLDAPTVQEIRASFASLVLNSKFPVFRVCTSSSSSAADNNNNNNSLEQMRVEMNPEFNLRMRKFTVPKAAVGGGGGGGAASGNNNNNNNNNSNNNNNNNNNNSNVTKNGGTIIATEDGSVPVEILMQRGQVLDASIVRIMKSKQKLPLNELANLVSVMIKSFPVTFKMVKVAVESLMERDFLKREHEDESTTNGAVFSYVA